ARLVTATEAGPAGPAGARKLAPLGLAKGKLTPRAADRRPRLAKVADQQPGSEGLRRGTHGSVTDPSLLAPSMTLTARSCVFHNAEIVARRVRPPIALLTQRASRTLRQKARGSVTSCGFRVLLHASARVSRRRRRRWRCRGRRRARAWWSWCPRPCRSPPPARS